MSTLLKTKLAQIENMIDQELTKDCDPGDTHDYSSSGYNGYADGYISGVGDATEAFREAIERALGIA